MADRDDPDSPDALTVARPVEGVRRSALAEELRALQPGVRRAIGVSDQTIEMIDGFVSFVAMVIDDETAGSLPERMSRAADVFLEPIAADVELFAGVDLAERVEKEGKKILAQFGGEDPRTFAKRLLGAARAHKVEQALKSDLSIALVGLRRLARAALPFALALEDACRPLDPTAIAEVVATTEKFGGFVGTITSLDKALDGAFDWIPAEETAWVPSEDRESLQADDLVAFADELRAVVSGQTREILRDLNTMFERKMQGARDALAFSSDAVSQAANSLIEFIDRLLRGAFTKEEVVAWVQANCDSREHAALLRTDSNGVVLPTKKAEALCFVYVGCEVSERNLWWDMLASTFTEARRRLQKLKHADESSPEEAEAVSMMLASVEGALMLVVKFAWLSAPDDRLAALVARLEPATTSVSGAARREIVA